MKDLYQQGTKKLLEKPVPTYHQAYNDSTAWLMSCLSELAYKRFNEFILGNRVQQFVDNKLSKLVVDNSMGQLETFVSMVEGLAYDHEQELKELNQSLAYLNAELIDTFDKQGTQAILVETEQYYALAFRGTEATSVRDIKSDVNAKLTSCETQGLVHSGFKHAYEQVASDITLALSSLKDENKPLLVTGHSLGGAIATIAAKRLMFKNGIAACYTFGAPRVGDHEWASHMKTPIYRIVNAADSVPMFPPNSGVLSLVSTLLSWIPSIGPKLKDWLSANLVGYTHVGDMRYLSHCEPEKYDSVQRLYHVSLPYRLKALWVKTIAPNRLIKDHSVNVYRKKLKCIAEKSWLGD
ncbi:lipase family protein [Vibrio aquimaris]|uniref:Lipase (Class 3) n=1 Tax=Vibrio aquimaris TaxID=2587862 RepID=A0A5P9CJW3_9VIBR|nr:lipase family protein [Vibrio aquimaris]QFT26550.1 Lipase (class 3) [Vibrio aquimaris]